MKVLADCYPGIEIKTCNVIYWYIAFGLEDVFPALNIDVVPASLNRWENW